MSILTATVTIEDVEDARSWDGTNLKVEDIVEFFEETDAAEIGLEGVDVEVEVEVDG